MYEQILHLALRRLSDWAPWFQPSEWFVCPDETETPMVICKSQFSVYLASLIDFILLHFVSSCCVFISFTSWSASSMLWALFSYRDGPGVSARVYPQCHSSSFSSRCDAVPPESNWSRRAKQHPFNAHEPLSFLLHSGFFLHLMWQAACSPRDDGELPAGRTELFLGYK